MPEQTSHKCPVWKIYSTILYSLSDSHRPPASDAKTEELENIPYYNLAKVCDRQSLLRILNWHLIYINEQHYSFSYHGYLTPTKNTGLFLTKWFLLLMESRIILLVISHWYHFYATYWSLNSIYFLCREMRCWIKRKYTCYSKLTSYRTLVNKWYKIDLNTVTQSLCLSSSVA